MNITMSSMMSSCFLGSVMILAFCFIVRKNSVIFRLGPSCIILILMSFAIRMFFPVELWFTYSIRLAHILPQVRRALNDEIIWNQYVVRVWDILMFIWAAGIVGLFFRTVLLHKKFRRLMCLLPSVDLSEFLKEAGIDLPNEYIHVDVKIVVTEFVQTPCLVGGRHGVILLPKHDYSKEELSYIIRHELMHYKNKDICKKIVTDLLCMAFWWNPVFFYLKRTVFHMIEISNDKIITEHLPKEAKAAYMQCLMNLAAKRKRQDIPFEVSFHKNSVRELKQRLSCIQEDTKNQTLLRKSFLFSAALLLIMSFFVILEPYTEAPEGIRMGPENTYLIWQGEQYDVYVDGEYFFSTDDLMPFEGVTVY